MSKPSFLYDVVIADDKRDEILVGEEVNITVKTIRSIPNGIVLKYFENPEKKQQFFKYSLYYTGDKTY